MIERLKKQLGIKDVVAPELSELQAQVAQLQSQFNDVQVELSSASALVASLSAEKDNLEAALATALEQNTELQSKIQDTAEKALETKLADRKAKLVAAVGDEKAEPAFEALKELEDAAFSAVVAAMATSVAKEAQTELFTETGVAGDAEPSKEMTAEEKLLREKYKLN